MSLAVESRHVDAQAVFGEKNPSFSTSTLKFRFADVTVPRQDGIRFHFSGKFQQSAGHGRLLAGRCQRRALGHFASSKQVANSQCVFFFCNAAMSKVYLSMHSGWCCHPEGSTALMYVPQQQILLSGGRHGEICIFDIRERKLRCTVKAFDHATVKTLALQPDQEGFLVGSSDGDIKVDPIIINLPIHSSNFSSLKMFSLTSSATSPQLLSYWPNEHSAKGGFSLRQVSSGQVQGVQQLFIDTDNRMYSCGADCSLKVRQLKQFVVDSIL